MKICSSQPGLVVKSSFPKFKYRFPEADVPVEVEGSHSKKILKNSTFYELKSKTPGIQAKPEKAKSNKNLNSSKDIE